MPLFKKGDDFFDPPARRLRPRRRFHFPKDLAKLLESGRTVSETGAVVFGQDCQQGQKEPSGFGRTGLDF